MGSANRWAAPTVPQAVNTSVDVPASKSLMARALVLAALAEEPTTLRNPLTAGDSDLMIRALEDLGMARASQNPDGSVTIDPSQVHGDAAVHCGLSGTVMRFLPPVAALRIGSATFDGDPRARERPMGGLLDALRDLGVTTTPADAHVLPFTVRGTGTVQGHSVMVDASESSQFVSGLLLAGCRFDRGLRLRVSGTVPSLPHIEMTVRCLADRGVPASQEGPQEWLVEPAVPAGGDVVIEPDLSNAAPFLAAAVVTRGRICIPNWPDRTTQAGDAIRGLLKRMGSGVVLRSCGLTVVGGLRLKGLGTVDLGQVGELTPTVAALAALATSPTTITGVSHLRGHETDRITALVSAIRTLGGNATETDDGLHIEPAPLHGGLVETRGDHRMATFAAIVGLVVPGVIVDDIGVTAKTMPQFAELWQATVA